MALAPSPETVLGFDELLVQYLEQPDPAFIVRGRESDELDGKLTEFYGALHNRELIRLSIESAELVKVSYNTFIGMKIAFANLLMEICHHVGGDVDDVTDTLSLRLLTASSAPNTCAPEWATAAPATPETTSPSRTSPGVLG